MNRREEDETQPHQSAHANKGNVKVVGRDNFERNSVNILIPVLLVVILGGLGSLMFFISKSQQWLEPNIKSTQEVNQK